MNVIVSMDHAQDSLLEINETMTVEEFRSLAQTTYNLPDASTGMRWEVLYENEVLDDNGAVLYELGIGFDAQVHITIPAEYVAWQWLGNNRKTTIKPFEHPFSTESLAKMLKMDMTGQWEKAVRNNDWEVVKWITRTGKVKDGPQYQALFDASLGGVTEQFHELLNADVSPNALCTAKGNTMLYTAVDRGDADLVRVLVQRGASPQLAAKGVRGGSVLHLAIKKQGGCDLAIIGALIDEGADVNKSDGQMTPIQALAHLETPALAQAPVECLTKLIAAGGDVNATASRTTFSPLIYAARHVCAMYCHNISKTLLKSGADPSKGTDDLGGTALHCLLMTNTNSTERNGSNGAIHDSLQTPLDLDVATAKLLIEAGADVNAVDKMNQTPVFSALRTVELASLLLEKGAKVNVKDKKQQTPLHVAAEVLDDRTPAVVAALVAAGANVNAKGKCGRTPLHAASAKDNAVVLKELLLQGADKDAKDAFKRTSLHVAAVEGSTQAVLVLIEADVDINPVNGQRQTPLHLAAQNSFPDTAKALLAHTNIDVHARDSKGATPLHSAAAAGAERVVSLLLEAGADPSLADDSGRTAAEVAREKRYVAIELELLSAMPGE
eukprot:TRINITY_DN3641_c0_g1_i1.p1 TRINITY_DN3641_c0_g1~~TRINITY_DN3641_c0_g1_i1.p1  ORF type:complete len:610 (+),score=112.37 TRINITY_DN3641_c0_g1_i1:67-1896(+)